VGRGVAERVSRRRREREGRALKVGDEAALEPAQKALCLVSQQRDASATPVVTVEGNPRGLRARDGAAVEVCRAGDKDMRRHDEQQQADRRARPHESPPLSAQVVAQVTKTFPAEESVKRTIASPPFLMKRYRPCFARCVGA